MKNFNSLNRRNSRDQWLKGIKYKKSEIKKIPKWKGNLSIELFSDDWSVCYHGGGDGADGADGTDKVCDEPFFSHRNNTVKIILQSLYLHDCIIFYCPLTQI